MKILYLGSLEWGTTSLQRLRALRECVDDVHSLDYRILISEYVKRSRWERVKVRTAWPPLVKRMARLLLAEVDRYRPDCVWVDQGILVPDSVLRRISAEYPGCRLVHYTPDSIMAPGMDLFRKAIPAYDLCITTKKREVGQYRDLGAGKVMFSWQAYDDRIHRHVDSPPGEREHYRSDLVFIGQYMPKRAEYLAGIAAGTDYRLGLYGRGWEAGATGPVLKPHARGWLYGDDYAKAISNASIALCFLNDQVGDDYTTRTFEIPACGTMMMAERTPAHQELFTEDVEAVYFDSVEECLDKADYYLSHDEERRSIAAAGHRRLAASGCTWRDRVSECAQEISRL